MASLTRALSRTLHSSTRSRSTTLAILRRVHSTAIANCSSSVFEPHSSTELASKQKREWPRPSEIPYQKKVANSVSLIGVVDQHVQLEASSDGKYRAGTVISQRRSASDCDASHFRIPILFEGDLAHTAACHIKKNDQIHISGQLFVDSLPSNVTQGESNVQVMVDSLNFVEAAPQVMKSFVPKIQEKGVLLHSANIKKDRGDILESWRELLDNPKDWWDYRDSKQNGLVKPKHPDFTHKDIGRALWLNTAPPVVLQKLKGVEFSIPISKPKQYKDELWKNLVENPSDWWDNRLDKKTVKHPDFKCKESRKGLWLSNAPSWVLPKLPPIKDQEAGTGKP